MEYCVQFCAPQPKKRQETTGECPVKGHKDDEGIGVSHTWRRAQGAGAVQSGGEEAQCLWGGDDGSHQCV